MIHLPISFRTPAHPHISSSLSLPLPASYTRDVPYAFGRAVLPSGRAFLFCRSSRLTFDAAGRLVTVRFSMCTYQLCIEDNTAHNWSLDGLGLLNRIFFPTSSC